MLMENEHDKPVDRTFLPYQQLAVAVIETALVDFGVMIPSQRRQRGRPPARTRLDRTIVGKLSTLRRQILAGAFLVERNDPEALMWFRLAGLNYELMRTRKPHWPYRLRAMREREEKMAEGLRRQLAAQLLVNREAGRGERDQGVGRHVVEPGAVPGRGLREEHHLGADHRDRQTDVFRRAWRSLANIDRRTIWPRGGAYGRLVGTLGDLPWLGKVPQPEKPEQLAC